jgi:capsular polysaccharide biosynthesis protein
MLKRGGRNTLGEKAVEEFCRQRGFRIVYPERMTFAEQVELFNAHDYFVGFAGSAFHSLLLRFVDRPANCLYMYDHRRHVQLNLIDELMGTCAAYVNCYRLIESPPGSRVRETLAVDQNMAIAALAEWANRKSEVALAYAGPGRNGDPGHEAG